MKLKLLLAFVIAVDLLAQQQVGLTDHQRKAADQINSSFNQITKRYNNQVKKLRLKLTDIRREVCGPMGVDEAKLDAECALDPKSGMGMHIPPPAPSAPVTAPPSTPAPAPPPAK